MMDLYIKLSVCVPRLIPGRGFYAQISSEITSEFPGVTGTKINLGEYSGTFKLIEQIIDPGKRVRVFYGDFIESSVVNAHPLRLVFLLYKNHRSTPWGSTRTYVPLFFQLFQLFLYFG